MRRLFAIAVTTMMIMMLAPAGNAQVPPTPPRDQWYAQNDTGHWQNPSPASRVRIDDACLGLPTEAERMSCSLDAFQKRPFVVIALTDSGINAYQQDFRAPEFVHHPSKYIEGYPQNAQALDLSLGMADQQGYGAARSADEAMWEDIPRNRLYWFPGTRIIGGISIVAGGAGGGYADFPILDENGHGTGTASVAAGQLYGSNPNALIVEVEGLGDGPLNWAAGQPWIDIVSNSWGPAYAGISTGSVAGTKSATTRGQSIVFSSGNGNLNTNSSSVFSPGPVPVEDPCKCKVPNSNVSLLSHNKGPSWIMTVGAASPINGQSHWWHGVPVDVSSFGSKWAAAGAFSAAITDKRDFGGTSCAAPITAGVLSSVILKAREVLGDTKAGQKPGGVVAQAAQGVALPTSGPLADGTLTRLEAEAIVVKTAQPVPFDPVKASWDYAIYPTTPTYYAYQGYGIVDRGSKARALSVLMGQTAMPDRAEVDTFMAQVDAARNAIYN